MVSPRPLEGGWSLRSCPGIQKPKLAKGTSPAQSARSCPVLRGPVRTQEGPRLGEAALSTFILRPPLPAEPYPGSPTCPKSWAKTTAQGHLLWCSVLQARVTQPRLGAAGPGHAPGSTVTGQAELACCVHLAVPWADGSWVDVGSPSEAWGRL